MNIDQLIMAVKNELVPSLGCTEPVAVGLAVSNTCIHLENAPTHLHLRVSSNVFKNAYFVTIPGTKESGIPIAASLGYLLAKQGNTMEIFADVTPELIEKAHEYIKNDFVEVEFIKDSHLLIEVTATNEKEKVYSITYDSHDKIVHLEKDGKTLIDVKTELHNKKDTEIMAMTIKDLVKIAETVPLEKLEFLQKAIEMNVEASNEGLTHDYGMKIGKTMKRMIDNNEIANDMVYYVKMIVSAAVDMRMGGGPKAAMTMLGSGNQGFESTLPIVGVCDFLKLSQEKKLRALFMCYIISMRAKAPVGLLSPICSALFTGSGVAAATAWLLGANQSQIEGAMQNIYSNLSGIMCDGAKDSCSSKISTCASEAILAAKLAMNGSAPNATDGIVSENIEHTLDNIARVSKESLKDVDLNLIDIMMNKA